MKLHEGTLTSLELRVTRDLLQRGGAVGAQELLLGLHYQRMLLILGPQRSRVHLATQPGRLATAENISSCLENISILLILYHAPSSADFHRH